MTLPRQSWWRRWFGSQSERAARRFLLDLGYRILRCNYRCRVGEIDLITLHGEIIVFVEVRSTSGDDPEQPAASVTEEKQRKITRTGLHFLQHYRLLNQPARFDVLAISWPDGERQPVIVHYIDAFPATGRYQMHS